MARGVDQVQVVGLAVARRVRDAHGLGLDRDPALALELHRVEHLGGSACASTAPVSSRMRSASVDLPWSMWAMIEKFRMRSMRRSGRSSMASGTLAPGRASAASACSGVCWSADARRQHLLEPRARAAAVDRAEVDGGAGGERRPPSETICAAQAPAPSASSRHDQIAVADPGERAPRRSVIRIVVRRSAARARCRRARGAGRPPGRARWRRWRSPSRRRCRRRRRACRGRAAATAVIARLTPEIAVGTQGRWRLKKVRVSSRKRPLKGSEKANQKSAVGDELGLRGVELAALVDEPDHRLREHQDRGGGRDQQQQDLAHPVGHRRAQVVVLLPRRRSGPGSGRPPSRSRPRRSPGAACRCGTPCRSPPAPGRRRGCRRSC